MINSWSLLFDELNMTEHSKYYYDYDRNDPNRPNPFADTDSLNIGSPIAGSAGSDYISFDHSAVGAAEAVPITFGDTFGEDSVSFNLDMTSNNPARFKYSEEKILKELTDYISATYNQHYSAGDDKVQTLDLIEACGDGESFCRSNILKYASRYDKKGTARRDIMKILHYAVLLMHFNDKNAQRETYPQ